MCVYHHVNWNLPNIWTAVARVLAIQRNSNVPFNKYSNATAYCYCYYIVVWPKLQFGNENMKAEQVGEK